MTGGGGAAAVVSEGGTANGVQPAVFGYVDFLNIMAYDGGSPHANYDWSIASANFWKSSGLPANKTVLGVPFYSHGWTVQGGYFILPKEHVELTVRYSEIRGNEGPNNGHAYEIGPGINWFISHNHNAKVQLYVAWVDISDNLPSNTESLRLGPNVPFGSTAAGFSEGEQGVLTRFQVQVSF